MSKGGGAPLPPAAARPVAQQDNSSPHPADGYFCRAGVRVSVVRAIMLACEASRLWRAHSMLG